MVCELSATAGNDGYLCLHLRSPRATRDWLRCELRGETVALVSASGRQLVSAQSALKLLLRELFLRELADGDALLPAGSADQLAGTADESDTADGSGTANRTDTEAPAPHAIRRPSIAGNAQ